ncbi:MAG: hypothetical protein P8N28_02970, partial [Phycisphaerales bacterium]|nr:hypothetical protein [Phycisphaerales bacterium]
MTEHRNPLRRKRRIWIFGFIGLLPFLLVFLLTRPFLLTPIVVGVLKGEVRTEVSIEQAHWDWSGKLSLVGLALHSENVTGPASQLLFAPTVEIVFSSFIPSASSVDLISAESITVRVAESSKKSGEYNFAPWETMQVQDDFSSTTSSSDTSSSGTLDFPNIAIDTIHLEAGTMQDGLWTKMVQKSFSVEIASGEESEVNVNLHDVQESLSLSMRFAEEQFQLSIDNVLLGNSLFSFLPRRVRVWCEETELHGRVDSLGVLWSAQDGLSIEATVENVQFFLPEEHGVRWAHYDKGAFSRLHGNAKLDVRNGTIVYNGESVSLRDIEGELFPPQSGGEVPVSFRADLNIFELPNFGEQDGKEWMETMLSKSPFDAKFFISDVQSRDNGQANVPVAAAKILKLFQLEKWNIASKVSVQREEFGQEAVILGEILIDGAKGMYEGFPYPLHAITSSIKFHNNEIE